MWYHLNLLLLALSSFKVVGYIWNTRLFMYPYRKKLGADIYIYKAILVAKLNYQTMK